MSYFKTLKSLLFSLSIIILLNIVVYYCYIITHPEDVSTTINTSLFKTTIGNMASSKIYY